MVEIRQGDFYCARIRVRKYLLAVGCSGLFYNLNSHSVILQGNVLVRINWKLEVYVIARREAADSPMKYQRYYFIGKVSSGDFNTRRYAGGVRVYD